MTNNPTFFLKCNHTPVRKLLQFDYSDGNYDTSKVWYKLICGKCGEILKVFCEQTILEREEKIG